MPILLPCEEIAVGMRLYEAVAHNGRVLLPAGKELVSTDVSALRDRYPGLMVRIDTPELDKDVDFDDDSRERSVAQTVQDNISGALTAIIKKYDDKDKLARANFAQLEAAVSQSADLMRGHQLKAAIITPPRGGEQYLPTHAGNVFFISMLLGSIVQNFVIKERQRQTKARALQAEFVQDITPLGLGAACIDVGMIPLQKLYGANRELTPAERNFIKEHPSNGADMLPESFSAVSRMIVRTHHENVNGSGYPKSIEGDRLHVFTRIVRIADAFDAATATESYKEAKSQARALWEMASGPLRHFYDQALMNVFSRLVQPFPVGSKVQLSDGRWAIVAKLNRRAPLYPTVVIAFDDKEQPLPAEASKELIRLADNPGLKLQTYRGEDLSYLYTAEADEETPLVLAEPVSLYDAAFP